MPGRWESPAHLPSGREQGSGCLDLKDSRSMHLPGDLERTLWISLLSLLVTRLLSTFQHTVMEEPNEDSQGLGIRPKKLGACVHSAHFCCLVHPRLVDHVLPDAAISLHLYLPRVSDPVGGRLLGPLPPPNPHEAPVLGEEGARPLDSRFSPVSPLQGPGLRSLLPRALTQGRGALWRATHSSLVPDLTEHSQHRG